MGFFELLRDTSSKEALREERDLVQAKLDDARDALAKVTRELGELDARVRFQQRQLESTGGSPVRVGRRCGSRRRWAHLITGRLSILR